MVYGNSVDRLLHMTAPYLLVLYQCHDSPRLHRWKTRTAIHQQCCHDIVILKHYHRKLTEYLQKVLHQRNYYT